MHSMRPVFGCLLLATAVAAACGGSSSSPAAPTSTYVIPAADLSEMLSEKVMGNAAATVSIIEYSSLTCPHCASFHAATLPQIKANYIDSGKVKLVYRDFPVPGASTSAVAYAAASLARCAGNARYFEALDLLYRSQATWSASANAYTAMKQAVASLAMTSEKMDACIASTDIQNEIRRVMAEAGSTYGVGATPTFIVNGQKIEGAYPYATFDGLLKTLVGS